ncbi:hypothetical protein [Pseudoclavibacter sp. 8L]|uniref:hypothetical protein n=1 Tax=Pseudoclavibacter sp. 8L TaxID=2653162 RepID=UPI0012F2B7D1|nr:hypothetical protein [Pseudoclavibacter sp. 8L]VXB32084.1 exported hypothetical protein [Pseudoclavibacter sp. 8L]
MPTPSPRLAVAGAVAAIALTLAGCSASNEAAPPAATATPAAETAAPSVTPSEVAEPTYAEQVEAAWLEGWGMQEFSDIVQPETGTPKYAGYITEVRSDAPGEVTAVLDAAAPIDADALGRFATEEYRLIQNVGTVELNKLTVTTADGSVTVEADTSDPYA